MLKRIRREMELWPHLQQPLVENNVLYCDGEEIEIPDAYPFGPPRIRNIKYITELNGIQPEIWCLALLSSPFLHNRYPTCKLPCTCCHTLTCPHNWNTACRLHQVWEEARFHTIYNRLVGVKLPCALPVDVLNYMVELAVIEWEHPVYRSVG